MSFLKIILYCYDEVPGICSVPGWLPLYSVCIHFSLSIASYFEIYSVPIKYYSFTVYSNDKILCFLQIGRENNGLPLSLKRERRLKNRQLSFEYAHFDCVKWYFIILHIWRSSICKLQSKYVWIVVFTYWVSINWISAWPGEWVLLTQWLIEWQSRKKPFVPGRKNPIKKGVKTFPEIVIFPEKSRLPTILYTVYFD